MQNHPGRFAGAERRAWGKRAVLVLCLCVFAFTLTACGDQTPAYEDAVDLFADGDYAAAAEAFDALGDFEQSATYAAYSHGLVYFDQGAYAAAEPYFEQTQDFMYGKQRYTYCHACVLQEGGEFDAAAAAFQSLGEFEDSALRASYCEARYAEGTEDYSTAMINYADLGDYEDAKSRLESLQRQVYDHAIALMDDGDYVQALKFFNYVTDYLHTREYIKECSDHYRDQLYSEAEAYEKQGELRKAYDLFSGLSSYRDAQTRANDIAAELGIDADE